MGWVDQLMLMCDKQSMNRYRAASVLTKGLYFRFWGVIVYEVYIVESRFFPVCFCAQPEHGAQQISVVEYVAVVYASKTLARSVHPSQRQRKRIYQAQS